MRAVVLFLLMMLLATEARAYTIITTITGTVAASSTDTTGMWGYAPGSTIPAGTPFTVVFTTDDRLGTGLQISGDESSITSTSSNPVTAEVTINNVTWNVPSAGSYGSVNSSITQYSPPASSNVSFGLNGLSGTNLQIVATPVNPWASGATWETYVPAGTALTGAGTAYLNYDDDTNVSLVQFSTATIGVSGPLGTNPVAKGNGQAACVCAQPSSIGQVSGGEPVNAGTGNMYEQVVDYTTAGQNPLAFIRSYNSMGNATGIDTYAYSLGVNWRSNYDRYLQINPTVVTAERPDGQVITFTLVGSTWTPDSDVNVSLTQSGTSWTLTDKDDVTETYQNAMGHLYGLTYTYGQLQTITTLAGYKQTLNYTGGVGGVLNSVSDSYGRSLGFTYGSNGLIETVTTPDSLVLTYGQTLVSGAGYQLTSVSYNTSPATSQTYIYGNSTYPFLLTGIEDELGNTYRSWTYDHVARATQSYTGGGSLEANLTNFSYSGNTTTVTNAFGVADTYTFATSPYLLPRVTGVSRAATSTTAAATRSFGYDANGYLNSSTDWNGNTTAITNNANGDPTSIVYASGSPVSWTKGISYDTTFVHKPHAITWPGLTQTFTYDTALTDYGNLLNRVDKDTTTNTVPYSTGGQTRTTYWTWNSTGQMLSVQLPRTDVTAKTSFNYDGTGALTLVKDALGHATNITSHTGGGLPLTIVDPNSVTTTNTYDTRLDLLTSAVSASGQPTTTTTWTYDAALNLATKELPDGSKLTYTYDNAHRLTQIKDIPGDKIVYTLDALGDVTVLQSYNTTPTLRYQRNGTYDALGRLIVDTNGVSEATDYTYDKMGNVLTVVPPSPSGTTTYTYDALNRLATKQDPSPGGTATFTYNALNNVTQVVDAAGNTTAYTFDGFQERTYMQLPGNGPTTYWYDADGNLTELLQGGPREANPLTYDAMDRLTSITYPNDTTLNVARTYDETGHGFGIGRLTSVKDQASQTGSPTGYLALTYDDRGNITYETRTFTGGSPVLTTATTYDGANHVSGITYPSGTAVAYTRNSAGAVTEVTAKPPGASSYSTVVTGIGYRVPITPDWLFGPVSGITYGNGITGSYSFDLAYEAQSHNDTGSSGTVHRLDYAYEPNGSLYYITDYVSPINTQHFGYDSHDRLTSATSASGGYGTYGWTWDYNDNPVTQVLNGTTTTFTLTSGTNKFSQYQVGSGTPYLVTYSASGNYGLTTQGGVTKYSPTYNQANLMGAVSTPSTSATYEYGFNGQRLEKTIGTGNTIYYQYSRQGNELLSENDQHGGDVADYIWLDPGRNATPVGEVNPATGGLYYFLVDRMGTPDVVTGPNASQSVAWGAIYNPFGDILTSTFYDPNLYAQNLRLPGQQYDAETGHNHNGFRNYAPQFTRYLETDPLDLGAGLNPFQYVGNNPFGWTDRWGLYTAIQITSPNGKVYIPMTEVKNPAQAASYGEPIGTSVAIAVPPGVDPQSMVNYWASGSNLPLDQENGAFMGYWFPYGSHDYKNIKNLGPCRSMYDAFGNFMYGATGESAGFSLPYLQTMASIGKLEWPGTNNPINVNDIGAGYNFVGNGGTLGTTNWTPPATSQ